MKWVDLNYLRAFPAKEISEVVHDRCKEMGVANLMSLSCDWNTVDG
jgi:hypothetical protein